MRRGQAPIPVRGCIYIMSYWLRGLELFLGSQHACREPEQPHMVPQDDTAASADPGALPARPAAGRRGREGAERDREGSGAGP